MMRTRWLRIAATATAAMLVVGCGSDGANSTAGDGAEPDSSGSESEPDSAAPDTEDAEEITINVWSWQSTMTTGWNEIFAVYEEQNPGITVEFTGYPGTDYDTALSTGLTTADGPDIAFTRPYGGIEPYVAAGQLEPLDATLIPGLATAFSEDSLEAATVEGTIYGVPFALQTVQVFYNLDIFEDLGLTPPATEADVAPMLETLVDAGLTPFAITGADAWQLVNVFDALVGPAYGARDWVMAAREGAASASDDRFVAALEDFEDLLPYFPEFVTGLSYADSQTIFGSGDAAMFPGGAWELGGFQDNNPDLRLGVFSMPGPAGDAPTWGYEDGSVSLSSNAANRAAALDLLEWMTSQEFGTLLGDTLKQIPSVRGIEISDPVMQDMVSNYEANPVPMIWVTDWFGVSSPAPYAALMNGTQELLLGTTTPIEVAATIDESIDLFSAGN
jgi:raffinose/stachyose/melibiose transport system substrate-binding protein